MPSCQRPRSAANGGDDAIRCAPLSVHPRMSAQGIEAAYLDLRPALLRYLRARGAGAQAEDVLQDLWLQLPRSGPVANPSAYLYRSAENLWRNELRAAARRTRRESAVEAGTDAAPAPVTPDAVVAARQLVAAARRRLLAAGGKVEAAFVLTRVEGLSQKEAAIRLGTSLSSVEKALHRAHRELAQLIAEGDGE